MSMFAAGRKRGLVDPREITVNLPQRHAAFEPMGTPGFGGGAVQPIPGPDRAREMPFAANDAPPLPAPRQSTMFAGRAPVATQSNALAQPEGEHTGHSPDYAGHYALHGRDEQGMMGKKKRTTAQKILKGIGDFALYYQAGQGDPMAIASLKGRLADRQSRQKAEAEFQEHSRMVNILLRQGMNPDEAELAALNPDKFAEEYVSRFRTREAGEGESIVTPHLAGGAPKTWTAPKTVVNENDVYRLDLNPKPTLNPNMSGPSNYGSPGDIPTLSGDTVGPASSSTFGGSPIPSMLQPVGTMRSKGAQAAQEAGLVPGIDGYSTFLRDYALDAQGPTAYRMHREDNDQSNTNNIRSTSVSASNNIRSTSTSAANNLRSTSTSAANNLRTTQQSNTNSVRQSQTTQGSAGYQGKGGKTQRYPEGTVIVGPKGQRMVRRNGQWASQN